MMAAIWQISGHREKDITRESVHRARRRLAFAGPLGLAIASGQAANPKTDYHYSYLSTYRGRIVLEEQKQNDSLLM